MVGHIRSRAPEPPTARPSGRSPHTRAARALVVAIAALLFAPPAAAQDASDGAPEIRESAVPRRTFARLLADLERLERPRPENGGFAAHLHIHTSHGLAYTRRLDVGERGLVLSVQGPVVGGEHPGLGFELRF